MPTENQPLPLRQALQSIRDSIKQGALYDLGAIEALDAYLAQPAEQPVELDERAEFESKFVVQDGVFFSRERNEYRSMNGRTIEETDAIDLNLRLSGWQARADLDRKPSCWRCNQPL